MYNSVIYRKLHDDYVGACLKIGKKHWKLSLIFNDLQGTVKIAEMLEIQNWQVPRCQFVYNIESPAIS